jgi:hypothetical protein
MLEESAKKTMRNTRSTRIVGYPLICILLVSTLAFGQMTIPARSKIQLSDAGIAKESADDPFVGDKLSPDLRELIAGSDQNRTVKVILQSDDIDNPQLLNALKRSNVRIEARAAALKMLVIDLPIRAAEAIAAEQGVKHLSLDREVKRLGHVEITTGASAMRAIKGNGTFDGLGIGIAILDSGIYRGMTNFVVRAGTIVSFRRSSSRSAAQKICTVMGPTLPRLPRDVAGSPEISYRRAF